jgi:thioesterase domain-containing protein
VAAIDQQVQVQEPPGSPGGSPTGGELEEAAFVQPRDPIELELALIWQAVLDTGPVSVRANFFELGGTSVDMAKVAAVIQERFDQDLPLAAFFQDQTVEELAGRFRDRTATDDDSPIVRLRRGGGGPPVYFFHEIYGDVTYAYDLAHRLGPDRPAYGFQPPGLYNDRTPLRDVPALAAEYVAAVRHRHPGGPYLLAGYCTGGIFALETAQQLRRAGERVALVAVVDYHPAQLTEASSFTDPAALERLLHREFVVHDEPIPFERFSALGRDGQIEYILDGWKEIDLAPSNAGPAFVRRFVDMYQINGHALATYEAAPYDGKVCLFLPSETLLPGQRLEPPERFAAAWRDDGVPNLDIHELPGHHFSLFSRPCVDVFGARLRDCIAEALGDATDGG